MSTLRVVCAVLFLGAVLMFGQGCAQLSAIDQVDPLAGAEARLQAVIQTCIRLNARERISISEAVQCHRMATDVGTVIDSAAAANGEGLELAAKMLRILEQQVTEYESRGKL